MFRICKVFEVESGHYLFKHPEKCKNPHGHSRRVEVVLCAESLDQNDMVCDYKAIKLAISDYIDTYDHAMLINTDSPDFTIMQKTYARVISFESQDPTTERIAQRIFEHIEKELSGGKEYLAASGAKYSLAKNVRLERVRVSETTSSWAEFFR